MFLHFIFTEDIMIKLSKTSIGVNFTLPSSDLLVMTNSSSFGIPAIKIMFQPMEFYRKLKKLIIQMLIVFLLVPLMNSFLVQVVQMVL